jgi:hypothetical protein
VRAWRSADTDSYRNGDTYRDGYSYCYPNRDRDSDSDTWPGSSAQYLESLECWNGR